MYGSSSNESMNKCFYEKQKQNGLQCKCKFPPTPFWMTLNSKETPQCTVLSSARIKIQSALIAFQAGSSERKQCHGT